MMSSSLCCCCWCCFLSVAGAKSTPFADSRRHESEPDNRLSWIISSSSCSLIDFVLPRVTLRIDSPLWTDCMLDWWRDAWGTVTGAAYSRNGRITAWISKWLCYSSRSLSLFKKTKPFASFCCDDVNMYGPGERRRSTTPDEVKRGSKLVELGEAKISSLVLDVSICIPVSLLVVQERRGVKYVAYRTCMTVWYLQFM